MAMAPEKSDSVPNVPGGRSWSSIAALNTSKRNKTNTIEVRLENEENTGCSLNIEEIERLVRRLKIKSSDLVSLQACPERRNVVFITLRDGVDANKFTQFANESFVLKEGVRTTTIKQASSREVHVKVFGLHPDTKDEAVVRYLNAHGKVNMQAPVKYGVYGGDSSSSILAGKRNGDRIYTMQVFKNIGSTHIIDGERVSVRYPGQMKTCNRCHQPGSICPGKGIARECTAPKVLLSDFMISYWKNIKFTPETAEMNEVDIQEPDVIPTENVVKNTSDPSKSKPKLNKEMIDKYSGVVIKGFPKDVFTNDLLKVF